MPDRAPTHPAAPVPGPPGRRPVPGAAAGAVAAPTAGPVPGPPLGGPTGRAAPGAGDPRVPEALAVLDGLAGLPPAEHVARLEDVHRLLQDALASLDGT